MASSRNETDYFQLASAPTYIIIVVIMIVGWVMWYDVNLLPTSYMGYLGSLLHYIGTNFRPLLLILDAGGLIEHACLSAYASYCCGKLKYSWRCGVKWIAQTMLLGYFSLSILIAHSKRSK
uniref:Transmembrane protein 254 n=1 Tax=Parascaris univalens TaxID=6257 RepID=A0A915BYS9_PARUN